MKLLIVSILIVIAAFLIAALVNANDKDKKMRDYREECARQELIQKQEEDNNLDKED